MMYQSGILWHFGFDCHYPDSFPGCYPDGKWKCFVLLVWSAGSVNCYQSRYDSRRYDITYAISIEHGTSGITYCRCHYCYLGDCRRVGYRFGQTQYHSADNYTDCNDSYSLFYLTSNTDYDVQTDSKYTSLCS